MEGSTKFRKGADSFKSSIASSGGGGKGLYFSWEEHERKTVRFLTDGDSLILIGTHQFITCHDGSKRSFVCRKELGQNCELCAREDDQAKKRDVGYGVAVWREETEPGSKVFVDKTHTIVTEAGEKIVPWVGIVQQSLSNFWQHFITAYEVLGSITDLDFIIVRTGKGKKTSYETFQLAHSPLDISKYEEYMPDIEGMLEYQGSDKYYRKWLHGEEFDDSDEGSSSTPSESVTVSADELAALRALSEQIKKDQVAS